MGLVGRIVIALIIAIVVGLVLVALLGPILDSLNIPIADVVGKFFIHYGWVLGILAGLWHFFTNGSWTTFKRP